MTRRINAPSEERSNLSMDVEFYRFLGERKADSQRDADRLQGEIETLLCQVDSKRREQDEHLNIVQACADGLARQTRPAPTLTPREAATPINGPLHGEGE